jgi:hypothetical protein
MGRCSALLLFRRSSLLIFSSFHLVILAIYRVSFLYPFHLSFSLPYHPILSSGSKRTYISTNYYHHFTLEIPQHVKVDKRPCRFRGFSLSKASCSLIVFAFFFLIVACSALSFLPTHLYAKHQSTFFFLVLPRSRMFHHFFFLPKNVVLCICLSWVTKMSWIVVEMSMSKSQSFSFL